MILKAHGRVWLWKKCYSKIDNIQAAWRWGVGRTEINKSISAFSSLGSFYNLQALHLEGEKAFQLAVAKLTPTKHMALSINNNQPSQVETIKIVDNRP